MRNKYIQLSHILSENTPSYGNRDKIEIRKNSSIQDGESANTSSYYISNNHIGTHIDVPFHFSDSGQKTFEIPINEYFYSKIGVVEVVCDEAKLIGIADLEYKLLNVDCDIELLLIKTGYENYRHTDKYWNDNPGLSPELADFLREKFLRLRCIGFDFISLTSWKYREFGKSAHLSFLSPEKSNRPILIIEDMSLFGLDIELENVIVLPLFIEDGNGGAVTVIGKEKV